MLNVSSPRVMREVLDEYGLSPLKKFGQNFLIDENILRRIAGAVAYESGCVLEIGAGLGALTQKLAEKAKKVLVYEIDKGLCNALLETLEGLDNVTVNQGDVLKADLEEDTAPRFWRRTFLRSGQPALLYHQPVHHAPAGGRSTHHRHGAHDAEGSSAKALRTAGQRRLWRDHGGGFVFFGAENALRRIAALFLSATGCGFHRGAAYDKGI